MGKIRLAVVGDTLYAGRLTECIRKNAPEYLEVASCRVSKELSEFLAQLQPDILLCEQGAAEEESLPEYAVRIQLTDDRENPMQIFRYQKGTVILRQIFQIYEKCSKKNLICRCGIEDMEMTAFYAPGGHELLLPFSMSYASLCGEHTKVLYLNLSEFAGMRRLFGNKDGNDLSDLIFGIRQRKDRFAICLQSVLHHAEQFDYVLPPENPEDLYQIQEEDLACLLELLQEQTDYKKIVWNCGTLNQTAEHVMEYCSRIFCIVKENAFGKYRKEEFEGFLQKELRQKLRKKVKYIYLQTGSSGFVPGMNILIQLQRGEFAKQVRKLTEETEQQEGEI